jgi:hypothetical protein
MEKIIFFSHPEKPSTLPDKVVPDNSTTSTTRSLGIEKTKADSDGMNEPMTRTTVDLPKKWHKALKRLLLEEDKSFKAYLLELMKTDLKNRGIEF